MSHNPRCLHEAHFSEDSLNLILMQSDVNASGRWLIPGAAALFRSQNPAEQRSSRWISSTDGASLRPRLIHSESPPPPFSLSQILMQGAMEVLQCDGCDFRAESAEELKTHLQDVHTAFLQPTEVHHGEEEDESSRRSRSNSLSQSEDEDVEERETGPPSASKDPGNISDSTQDQEETRPAKPPNRTSSPFFQCKFCVRYFRSSSLLSEHSRKVHGEDNVEKSTLKVFSCQYCAYKSPRRARVVKHQSLHHQEEMLGESVPEAEVLDSDCSSLEDHSDESPVDVERQVLESMIKPQSRGGFYCEWCGFQTSQRQQLADHMMKKHRNMVKIMVSLQHPKSREGSAGSSKSDSSRRSTPTSSLTVNDSGGNEGCSTKTKKGWSNTSPQPASGISSFQYSQLSSRTPNSTGSSILSKRSSFTMPDISRSGFEGNAALKSDSRSSSDDELADLDDPSYAEEPAKQLLSEEDNVLLETKGVPFRRHMNRFQCPFCSFLTMHRRSISRHIENIHLSGKATLYKCDQCAFLCTNKGKLDAHKQSHSASSDWDTMDLTSGSPEGQGDSSEPLNGGSSSSKMNGKRLNSTEEQQGPHRCSMCSFSTVTLKGLRVHQQHKHLYCDGSQVTPQESSCNDQQDSGSESCGSSSFVQKTQTSILGFSNKKHLIGKTARKSINDLPLDLSPVKKRTRIDEIANNLQSKISRSQQHEDVINLEEMEDEMEENGNHVDKDQASRSQHYTFNAQTFQGKSAGSLQTERGVAKRKRSLQTKVDSRNVAVTISDDEDAYDASMESVSAQDASLHQESMEYTEVPGTLFYCKHCEYQNKSARSVSTHYQRMHPYIKFSFRYILDPEDHSAVFRCLECFVEYDNFNDLHQHYMTHHPEASNVLNFNQPDLVYMCRFCSYTSPNVRSLMPHYQRMHPSVKINNAMIFSSYMVDQPHKTGSESQTLREILNSGPKSFSSASSGSRSSSSPAMKSISKSPEANLESEALLGGNVVVYDCDVCTFSSPNLHSVLVHYQKKHPEQKASYFRIQKTMRVVSVERAQTSTSSSYSLSSTPKSSHGVLPAPADEDLFYCKHCVYSNRSVVGVLVHYQKRHPEIKVTAKYIKQAPPTPGLLKLMDELQIAPPKNFQKQFSNNGVEGAGIASAKEKAEPEMLFFCQHCDYGNRTVKGVLIHYQKKHKDVKANADLVRRHTAVVQSQRERAQMIQPGASTSHATNLVSEVEKPKLLRSLKCRHCSYSSPYVYALKKHLKKDHPTVKATAMTILHWAYQDGVLEAGYHCEWCIYSHAEPSGLLMHYQRRHPEHNVDYTYMASKLWAGPDSSASRQAANSDGKHYQCRDCAFEACTIWDITNHYQAVHPWAIKGDESVLIDIIKGNQEEDKLLLNQPKARLSMPSSPIGHQHDEAVVEISRPMPERQSHLSLSATSSISNNPYQCTVCLSEYNSLHGLLTHYGKKHPGMKVKAADFAQEADINPSSVYKCRHCPYVNSRIHGVLTHYQKRHPSIKVTAEDFVDDVEHVSELPSECDERSKSQRQGYGAYRCKMCSYTHGTLEKLKIHYEKYHHQPTSDIFKTIAVHSPPPREDSIAECSSNNVTEVPEVSDYDLTLVNSDKHALFKCQLCKYFCSTRKGIARHYRIKHNNVRAQPEGKNNVFKCALCSYTNPIRKGLAAHYQKRHDIDAYYTHCLAASKTMSEKPNKVMVPLASDTESQTMSEELRLAVDRKKCSLCSFQAFSRKSIVSHYIKRHPGVFPKKQSSSKLGRYYTVIYAKESEEPPPANETEIVEVKDEVEPESEGDWLPFKCTKCFKLSFSAKEYLVMHYNDCHDKELKRDFVSVQSPTEEETELYQCTHCEIKFLTLPELSFHLMNHNEDFQKKAMRLERRKQLQSRQKPTEALENKVDPTADRTPVGYRCNFCVEVHPTMRAICNHLRKHVQYSQSKGSAPRPMDAAVEAMTNGEVEDADAADANDAANALDADALSDTVAMEPDAGDDAETFSHDSPEAGDRVGAAYPCSLCNRMFMSMQGLRSHERSHSNPSVLRGDKHCCQYCAFSSPFRHNLDRHVQSHHGNLKPFRCKICPFKSSYLSRLKSHTHKAHTETLTLPTLRAGAMLRSTRPSSQTHSSPDHDESAVSFPEPSELEQQEPAPGVQFWSGSDSSLVSSVTPRMDCILTCEFCEFSSGYMQSLRRHYRDRHGGKKLFKCKDCAFFTCHRYSRDPSECLHCGQERLGGSVTMTHGVCVCACVCVRSRFTLHVEAGHAGAAEEPQRDLRCPFCHYQSKHKNSLIDHVLQHRGHAHPPSEEASRVCKRLLPLISHVTCAPGVCSSETRLVPLQLSQAPDASLLSCDLCSFNCSTEEGLESHLETHGPSLRPYQCLVCFYQSGREEEMETHLREQHKVMRNFEMVGRVDLDQLDQMRREEEKNMSDEEEKVEKEEDLEEDVEDTLDEEDKEEQMEGDEEEALGKRSHPPHRHRSVTQEGVPHLLTAQCSACSSGSELEDSVDGGGKRFPCEFCGRTFDLSLEWERHVLRHGMTVSGSKKEERAESSSSSSLPLIAPLAVTDRSSDTTEQSDQSEPPIPSEEAEQMLETKNDA
ncbi:hypothetical protein DNTS_009425 [Danionella cerebrum]|uniref:C2H2-type domain-containing protein n=1 Tax=Danionella cerebrum TaxID=2873325 RepID=A0A553NIB9_9TELE|nr:hypothetical protein DNTS_009425 [Danionella translucida]